MRNRVTRILMALAVIGCLGTLGCDTSAVREDVAAVLRDSIKTTAGAVGSTVIETIIEGCFGGDE